ncbi:MAG TPA: phosphatidate cytidylyltransferase [Burkholderiales bacterium]|nr:phosphatidate cytidylyltransferase [Burkholderiales bacterium]
MKGALAARVATAAALIVGFLAALFLLPRDWLAGLIALLVAAAGFEWARLCRIPGGGAWIYGVVAAAAFIALFAAGEPALRAAFAVSVVFWILAAPVWLARGVKSDARAVLIAAGFVVIVPAALALATLPARDVLLVLVLVWIADTAAYFVGRAWGRRKLAPSISPGKTWEGAVGGVFGALAYAIICGSIVERIAWGPLLAAAMVLAALSIVGDLFESAAKRQAGVKDSGALLPGHGGILDRIDSATATLPLAALLLSLSKA